MATWNRPLFAAAGFLMTCLLLALIGAPPARTQGSPSRPPTPVEVVNGPVPVTGNLSATVAGTVQAQQSGPWTVGIAGTPSVNIGNALLPVQAMNDALYEPYGVWHAGAILQGEGGKVLPFDVPDGKRLIIETVTVKAEGPQGQGVEMNLWAGKMPNDIRPSRYLALDSRPTIGGRQLWVGTHPIKIRVDGTAANNEVEIGCARTAMDGVVTMSASIDGYLVDLPGGG